MNDDWNNKLSNWKKLFFNMKKSQILLILFAGILLIVASLPKKASKNQTEQPEISINETNNTWEEYENYMEKRVEKALANVEGVGKTEVVLSFRTNGEKIVEKDIDSDKESVTENDSAGGIRETDNTAMQKKSIYEQQKDGTQSPYVSKELTPEIEGVLVVAEGGENPVVIKNITEAIQALFGVEAHKIKIMKRAVT